MSEIHQPTHRQAVAFFIFTLCVTLGILAWVFFLNKGTAVFVGSAPFSVEVGTTSKTCEASPCSLSTKPGSKQAHIFKTGYFEVDVPVVIPRWGSVTQAVVFERVPFVQKEVGGLPASAEAPLAPFIEKKLSQSQAPRGTTLSAFSATGKGALFVTADTVFVAANSAVTPVKTPIVPAGKPVWVGENIAYMETTPEAQSLKVLKAGAPELIAQFKPALSDFSLVGSSSAGHALVTEDVRGTRTHYLIDLTTKSRKRLAAESSWRAEKITKSAIYFNDEAEKTDAKVVRMSLIDGSVTRLKAPKSSLLVEAADGTIYFLSRTSVDSEKTGVGISIEEAIQQAQKISPSEKGTVTYYVVRLESSKNVYKTLTSFDAKGGEPKRLDASADGKSLYFEYDGGVWRVVLRE